MPTVSEHYDRVLSDVYSWMAGGFDSALAKYDRYFQEYGIRPSGSGLAFDLGAGCGFQSIPLAKAGFSVTAVDTDEKLLSELAAHAGDLPIRRVQDDLVDFDRYATSTVELVVCMTDTILHLESSAQVVSLFGKVYQALDEGGRFIFTYRDLSGELTGLDRFIPIRSDDNTLFTCFLEYESETVKVHDLVYRRNGGEWTLSKGFYRKLRLSRDWIDAQLASFGFSDIDTTVDGGIVNVITCK